MVFKADRIIILFLSTLVLVLIICGSASAADVYVSTTGNDSNTGTSNQPFKTIQKGIDTVNSGGTVYLDSGVYKEHDILIQKNLTIQGVEDSSIIDAENKGRIINIPSSTNSISIKISDLTLKNGKAPDALVYTQQGDNGGGIYNNETLTLVNCVITLNQAGKGLNYNDGGDGGGIANFGTMIIQNSTISSNIAGEGGEYHRGGRGGGVANFGTLTLENTLINDNHSGAEEGFFKTGKGGGGIYNSGILTIKNCDINYNSAGDSGTSGGGGTGGNGGGIYNNGGIVNIENCDFNFNSAGNGYGTGDGGDGGAIANEGNMNITGGNIISNSAGDGGNAGKGGGIFNNGNMTVIEVGQIKLNYAGNGTYQGQGGGIYNNGKMTILYTTITGNYAGNTENTGGHGGGIANNNIMSISGCNITENNAGIGTLGGYGGGISNFKNAQLNLVNCNIENNSAGDGIVNILLLFNGYTGSAGCGGGISNEGTMSVYGTTKILNNNGGNGGNSTIQISTTPYYLAVGGRGGGIYNTGTMTIKDNTTIEGNHGGIGGNGGDGKDGDINSANGSNGGPGGTGGDGGGIYNSGTMDILGLDQSTDQSTNTIQIKNNIAGNGGNGGNGGNAYKPETSYLGNGGNAGNGNSGGSGGGILNFGNMTIKNCDILNNTAGSSGTGGNGGNGTSGGNGGPGDEPGCGGGILNGGNLSIIRSTLDNNTSGNGGNGGNGGINGGNGGNGYIGGDGGGIYNQSNVTINECSINNNQCGQGGNGGSSSANSGEGGSGGRGGYGGAIMNYWPTAKLSLNKSIIANNRAGNGGNGGNGYIGGNGAPGGSGAVTSDTNISCINNIFMSNLGSMGGQGGNGTSIDGNDGANGEGCGIYVGPSGYIPTSSSMSFNAFGGNQGRIIIIDNTNTHVFNLDNNWWGSNVNPKTFQNFGGNLQNFVIDKWITMSGEWISTTQEGTYTITTDFKRNNLNEDTLSTYNNIMPNGTPITFNTTDGFFISGQEITVETINGAASTFFASTTDGMATIAVKVASTTIDPIDISNAIPDTTRPQVTVMDPVSNAVNVPVNKVIVVTFSEPIKEGVSYNSITLKNANGSLIPITKTITGYNLIINQSSTYLDGLQFTLTLPVDSISDLVGNGLVTDYISSFSVTPYVDLVTISLSIPTAQQSFLKGSTITIDTNIKNFGNTASPGFNTNIWLSTTPNQTGGTQYYIGTIYTNNLASGTTKYSQNTFTIPISTLPGNYYIIADPDPANIIIESNETNNKGYSTSTLSVQDPFVDLVATTVRSTQTTYVKGGVIAVEAFVKNCGNTASPSFATDIWLYSTNSGGTPRYYIGTMGPSGTVAAGITKYLYNTFTLPNNIILGNYYLVANPDPSNTITESNETNNKGYSTSTLSVQDPFVDLVATTVRSTQTTISRGEKLSVDVFVKNIGNTASSSFYTDVWLCSTNTYGTPRYYLGTVGPSGTLAAGITKYMYSAFTIPNNMIPGSYYLAANPDPNTTITESNETNNRGYSTSTITVT